jgi:hypothetical protein
MKIYFWVTVIQQLKIPCYELSYTNFIQLLIGSWQGTW